MTRTTEHRMHGLAVAVGYALLALALVGALVGVRDFRAAQKSAAGEGGPTLAAVSVGGAELAGMASAPAEALGEDRARQVAQLGSAVPGGPGPVDAAVRGLKILVCALVAGFAGLVLVMKRTLLRCDRCNAPAVALEP